MKELEILDMIYLALLQGFLNVLKDQEVTKKKMSRVIAMYCSSFVITEN